MRKLILFSIVSFVYINSINAQFISNKGEHHIAAGALISASTYTIVYSKTKNKHKAFWYGLGASAMAGIAKEVYDSTKPNILFDTPDVAATVVGGFTACITLNLFVGKKKRKKENQEVLVN